MYAGVRPRHIFRPFSKISRSSLNTPMLISASAIDSSLLPFSQLPLTTDGTYCVVSMSWNFLMSASLHPALEYRIISAARGHCSAHHAACTGPLEFLCPPVSVLDQAFM